MLRALIILLLLVNGLIWLWGEGYLQNYWPFPDHQDQSQPYRKLDQYEPERLILMPDAPASPPVASGTTDLGTMPSSVVTASGLAL
jgi:hypothetical protein